MIRGNSYILRGTSNSVGYYAPMVRGNSYILRGTSNSVGYYAPMIRNNSYILRSTSNSVGYYAPMIRGNSYLLRATSAAVNRDWLLLRTSSNSLRQLYTEVADLETGGLGAIVSSRIDDLYVKWRTNSNTIVCNGSLLRNTSRAMNRYAPLVRNNSYWLRVNSNAIKTIADQMNPHIEGTLTSNFTLRQDLILGPTDAMRADKNITINGQGCKIIFAGGAEDTPQFVIARGKKVVFKNVTLSGLRRSTFKFESDSSIEMRDDVVFEFYEDFVMEKGWNSACAGSVAAPVVLTFRGLGTQKSVTVAATARRTLDLDIHSLRLENVRLVGAHNITVAREAGSTGTQLIGSLGLFGNATVELEQSPEAAFFVAQRDNSIILLKDKLKIKGPLYFDAHADAELHINFSLSSAERTQTPQVSFMGDCLRLESQTGTARLFFDAPVTVVVNETATAFVTGNNAYLGGQQVEISKYPIKVTSRSFSMAHDLTLVATTIDPLEFDFARTLKHSKWLTAFQILTKPMPKQTVVHTRSVEIQENADIFTEQFVDKAPGLVKRHPVMFDAIASPAKPLLRSVPLVTLPDQFDLRVNNILSWRHARGTFMVDGGMLENFGIKSGVQVQMYLGNNAIIQTSEPVTFDSTDKIYVYGKNNIISVAKALTMHGTLVFDVGAELTFEFDEGAQDPWIEFSSSVMKQLELASNAKLIFKGKGTVFVNNGFEFVLNGDSQALDYPLLAFQDSAILTLRSTGEVTIGGTGQILFDNAALLKVGAGQHVVVGAAGTDTLDFLVDRHGTIRVDTLDTPGATENARLSFKRATYNLDFERGGSAFIGQNGILEINALNGTWISGLLQTFTIGFGGTLFVDVGGTLAMFPNKKDQATHAETLFSWVATGGTFAGDGVIKLANTELAGQRACTPASNAQLDMQSFVLSAINQNQDLTVSTYFITGDNQKKLRAKTGAIVDLLSDDEISRDDATTGVVYGYNRGNLFTISPDGKRQ
jgi:hypothetical protein